MPKIPPFLFRVASENSRGFNDSETIDPLDGYSSDYHEDVDSIPLWSFRMMIYDHINWEYRTASEFSSWSASILFVLVHAARKHLVDEQTDIVVYIMDTSKLPLSRIHSAVDLLKEHGMEWAEKGKKRKPKLSQKAVHGSRGQLWEYAQGEYLVNGKIEKTPGLWSTVKMDDLVEAGLFSVFWELGSAERCNLLHQRILQLRFKYFLEDWPLEENPIYAHARLASLFGAEWQGAVLIALLATRKRVCDVDNMSSLLETLQSSSYKLPQLPFGTDMELCLLHRKVAHLPEVSQFMVMLRMLHDRQAALVVEG